MCHIIDAQEILSDILGIKVKKNVDKAKKSMRKSSLKYSPKSIIGEEMKSVWLVPLASFKVNVCESSLTLSCNFLLHILPSCLSKETST